MSQTSTLAKPKTRPVIRELKCPKCGSPIKQFSPDAQTLVCPACHSTISEGEEGLKVTSGSKLPQPRVPIRVGQRINFENVKYFVLGRVVYQGWDPEDTSDTWSWNEWLLGSDDGRLLWLSLDEHGLILYNKLRIRAPFDPNRDSLIPVGEGKTARVTERYPARVMGAEGELTWQAKRGDKLTMVEGMGVGAYYSIQVTPSEIEIHEGKKLNPAALEAMFGKEAAQALKPSFSIMQELGFVCFGFAVVALIIAFRLMFTGDRLTQQTINLSPAQEYSFNVNFRYPGRPAIVKLTLMNGLPVNTFAEIDVVVDAPDESETYISLQEFWNEEGYEEGEYWQESYTSGTDYFVPYQSGEHVVTVSLDEAAQIGQAQVKIEILDNHISPNWVFGYAVILAIIGVVLIYFGSQAKKGI